MPAEKLCCTVPVRAESPDDTPPRPVKHFRSLANIKSHFANGKYTSADPHRSSDEDQPLYPAEDLELQRIFVAASLPEDHPDTLKISGRKPILDETITCSPTFTSKIRRQLSRKTLATGASVSETIRKPMLNHPGRARKQLHDQRVSFSAEYDHDAQSLHLDGSQLTSLDCKDENATYARHVEGSTDRDALLCSEGIIQSELETIEARRSNSFPLTFRPSVLDIQRRRSQSCASMHGSSKDILTLDLPGPTFINADEVWPLTAVSSTKTLPQSNDILTIRSCAPEDALTTQRTLPCRPPMQSRSSQLRKDKSRMTKRNSNNSLHLYDMRISHHLRTKSQLTDATCTDEPESRHGITHASLNSVLASSINPTHRRDISNSGFASSNVPSNWGRVLEDESSSIYSRRTSTALETQPALSDEQLSASFRSPGISTQDEQTSNNTAFLNSILSTQAEEGLDETYAPSLEKGPPNSKSRPSLPNTAENWPIQDRSCSVSKSDSSASIGRLSKFREKDITDPPASTKARKKSRFVLRLWFPRLVRSKMRSSSTPLLESRIEPTFAAYDGPGDASDRLSVPQSSSKQMSRQQSIHPDSSVDVKSAAGLFGNSLMVNSAAQSRKSLVDYERNLSVVGDSRRRRSTLSRLKSYSQTLDDSEHYNEPEPVLHRATPLFKPGREGTEEALMEKALQQHQLEKAALMRSNTKKPEVTLQAALPPFHAPIFTSPFSGPSSGAAKEDVHVMDDLDPLEAESSTPVARRSQSMHNLPQTQLIASGSGATKSQKRSTTWTVGTTGTGEIGFTLNTAVPPASWSSYPSQTRETRCGTADHLDGVIGRDFAHFADPHTIPQTEATGEAQAPPKRWPRLSQVKKSLITKSRSMTFGTVFRYYSGLLTSSAARNRRSSTATGGRLEHPELEVLPPILPSHVGFEAKGHVDGSEVHHEAENHSIEEHDHNVVIQHSTPPHTDSPLIDSSPALEDCEDTTTVVQEDNQVKARKGCTDESDSPFALDGTIECKSGDFDRALSARRLSRMYQAYVQLPTSSDNTEVEQSGHAEDGRQIVGVPHIASTSSRYSIASTARPVAMSPVKPRVYSGPVIRRFPSVAIVDDRKGHWRSISLMSVDSGKSVRKSTRDLLELVRATETQELEKLLGKPGSTIT